MLRTIWVVILLGFLNGVNNSLPEVDILSHLESAAELGETGSQTSKLEAKPALLTSSRPATPNEVKSNQKLKEVQISESCVKEGTSDSDDILKAPLQRGAPVKSKLLGEEAIEQSRDSRIGPKSSNYPHQTIGSSSGHLSASQTSNFIGPADTPKRLWEPIYQYGLVPRVTYAPVWAPFVTYEPVAIFDHYKPQVQQYPPVHMYQGRGRESGIASNQVDHVKQSSQASCSKGEIEEIKPAVALTPQKVWKPKSPKEISSPQLETTSTRNEREKAEKVSHLSNSPKPIEKALKTPMADSGIDKLTTQNNVGQGSRKNLAQVPPMATGGVSNKIQEVEPNQLKPEINIRHDKSAVNVRHEEGETRNSALKSASETHSDNDPKPELDREMSWKDKLLKEGAVEEDKGMGSRHQNGLMNPDEKFLSKKQQTVGNVYSFDQRVVSKENTSKRLDNQLDQRKPLVLQSNENYVSPKEDPWIVVEKKQKTKGLLCKPQSSKTQKPHQDGVRKILIDSPFGLDRNEMLSKSKLEKMRSNFQSKPQEVKISSPENTPRSSFPKQNKNVDENKGTVLSSSLKNLERQNSKGPSDIERNINTQESSELGSDEYKDMSKPQSTDNSSKAPFNVLASNYLSKQIGIEKRPGHQDKVTVEAGQKTQKKRGKEKSNNEGTETTLQHQDNKPAFSRNKHATSKEFQSAFEISDLNVFVLSALEDNHHNSPVNRKHNIEAPLPEPAFVLPSKNSIKPDLWESQLYGSPVNPKAVSGTLRKKAESVLEIKWRNMEDEIFSEAFSPWKKAANSDKIYIGLQKSQTHFQSDWSGKSEINNSFEAELSQRLQEHLKVKDESQHLTLDDLDKKLFKMLQGRWYSDQKGLMTKLRKIQNDFNDINEYHRRLYTLSRQILHHTIVENWKNIKSFLVETKWLPESDVEEIEARFQLFTRFPDLTKQDTPFNESIAFATRLRKNKVIIKSMLDKVMGPTEAEARIETFLYLHQSSKLTAWWRQTDYMEQYRGNGLNLWEVLSIGKSLSFGAPEFKFAKDKVSELLNLIQGIYTRKLSNLLPWFVSPERAFLMKNSKEKYETRIEKLLNFEFEQKDERRLHATILAHKDRPTEVKFLMVERKDVWDFFHRGLSSRFMAEMLLAGAEQAGTCKALWRTFLNRAPNLLTEEQNSFVIDWFATANQHKLQMTKMVRNR
ncbi:hypothetical protein O181_031631 [Austropuccinia psidii MF-1]|uniref:Uncharacterized protein n=1 Tax=Austropuccinia psidii MF-1 TaxID=1389203 RepID=A0A9Q3D0V2_9BASI|nr:hypothetical protein [Austropuccinia psidii MF-1]